MRLEWSLAIVWAAVGCTSTTRHVSSEEPTANNSKKTTPKLVDTSANNEVTAEESWLLAEARKHMSLIDWDSTHIGLAKKQPFTPTAPLLHELSSALQEIVNVEPSGVAPRPDTNEIPRPWWKFFWLDLDDDGREEVVLLGGQDPAPFFAVIQKYQASTQSQWRVLHHRSYEFLGVSAYGSHVYLFGGFDGYGVAGPTLVVDRVNFRTIEPEALEHSLRFDLLGGETHELAMNSPISGCSTKNEARLRTEPKTDDKPKDSGCGVDLPGNLIQTLAVGSTGWRLHQKRTGDGQDWVLCSFIGEYPLHDPDSAVETMLNPKKLARKSLLSSQELIVGWLHKSDLVFR